MRVYIVGMGYVGLVTGVCLAELGHEVLGVDIDKGKIDMLREGNSPIFESHLTDLLKKHLVKQNIAFREKIDHEINQFDLAIIAVGTPERSGDGRADMFYVASTAEKIAINVSRKSFVVIGKSTVPIGTAEQINESLRISNLCNTFFHVGSNPETLREGNAVYDFLNPDRIIIGGDKQAQECLLKLYKKIECKKIVTDSKSAEMIKLASNFMLANRISITNILAQVCEKTGANIEEVMLGVGLDKRIGPDFLRAGIGYGGSCFPKDTKSIRAIAKHHGIDTSAFDSVVRINKLQKDFFFKKLEEMTLFTLRKKRVAVWGLSFKPETDDIREAPSVYLIKKLLKEGASVTAFDPVASLKKVFSRETDRGSYKELEDPYDVINRADILLVLTEWRMFRQMNMEKVKAQMKTPKVLDGRNIFSPSQIKELGFDYQSIGRP